MFCNHVEQTKCVPCSFLQAMRQLPLILLILIAVSCQSRVQPDRHYPLVDTEEVQFFPAAMTPDSTLPSPAKTREGRHLVLARLQSGQVSYFDVTVEQAGVRDVPSGQDNKGNQLLISHSEHPAVSMTGKSVAEITIDAWPGAASWAGFLCRDETILTRLSADDQLVKQMNFTHQQLAFPVFHTWNLIREYEQHSRHRLPEDQQVEGFYYNNQFVELRFQGGRGWQTSIFNDSLTGSYQIQAMSEKAPERQVFFSDLAPYYIHRYGFYEGMTAYRLDPRNIALTFGLLTEDQLTEAGIGFVPEDTLYCADAYIEQDSLWKAYYDLLSETANQPALRDERIAAFYGDTRNELRRICLAELKGSAFFTTERLLEEYLYPDWEPDTLVRNALVKMGPAVIPELTRLFQDAADSLVRWKALNTLGKIGGFADTVLLRQARQDASWLVQTEARFLELDDLQW